MTTAGTPDVLGLRRLALRSDPTAGPTDAELLTEFIARRDELAFEALVRRHGPMVLGVCRRLLGNEADAQDAFQATFLVLVRKANTILPRSRVGNWLHGVARQTAGKARTMSQTRRRHEQQARPVEVEPPPSAEDLARLDAEIARLPDIYRETIVLCELEGKTLQETARQLGCPVGTVASRLARGRALLARRLGAISAVGLSGLFAQVATANLPAGLTSGTVTLAVGGALPATILNLTQGVLKAMLWTKLKSAIGVVCLLSVLGVGTGSLVGEGPTGPPAAQFRPAQEAATWRERTIVYAHDDRVNQVAFSPDGKLIASSSDDKTVRVWDVADGREYLRFRAHSEPVQGIAFAPDGKLIASAGQDHCVILLDPTTGKMLHKLATGRGQPVAVLFSPECKLVGAVLADGGQRIWDVATGKLVEEKAAVLKAPVTIAFAPDGQRLYAAGTDGRVRIWDAATGKEQPPLTTPHTDVWSFGFTPTGDRIVLGGREGGITVWDIRETRPLIVLPGHRQPVRTLAISPDGKVIASGGPGEVHAQMFLWDATTGKALGSFDFERGGEVTTIVFSPDGKTLICVTRSSVRNVKSGVLRFFEPAK